MYTTYINYGEKGDDYTTVRNICIVDIVIYNGRAVVI